MPPWVLLRGLTRERGHWGGFEVQLGAALGAEVHALDLPGNGARWCERSPARIGPLADDLLAQLDRRGLRTPVSVLAMSMGALVAVELARRQPQRLQRLVLVSTSLRPWAPWHWRLRPAAAAMLLWRLAVGAPRPLETAILRLTSARADDSVLDRWLALRARAPVTRANALRQLLAAARYRVDDGANDGARAGATAPPALPLLLLAGRGDRLVDHRCSERLAAAWGCPLRLHDWAGHDLPLDDPGWVIAQLRA